MRSGYGHALFMEMRLGKTLVTIRANSAMGNERNLVVAPLTVLEAWMDELDDEGLAWTLAKGTVKQRGMHEECMQHGNVPMYYLVNYETLLAHPTYCDVAWDSVVLDESTRIKNPRSKTTKLCLQRFKHVGHKFILSGLPAPEGPLDYFCQMMFAHGNFLGSKNYYTFRHHCFNNYAFEYRPKPGVLTRIRNEVRDRSFTLTRKEAGIGNKRVYEKRYVDMTRDQRAAYRDVLKDFEYGGKSTKWVPVQVAWLAQIAGGHWDGELISSAKVTALVELLEGELRGQPVVVFFRHNAELRSVAHALNTARITYDIILGANTLDERREARAAFQSGHVDVLLLQIKCVKYGINLSASSTCIYFSNPYSLEERKQSEDRVEHAGKSEPLLYVDLITRGTVDEDIVALLREKNIPARYFMSRLVESIYAAKNKR